MVASFFDKCYTYCQVMHMKITVLTENTSHCGLPAEHGISFYIETGAHKLLFDTGQSALFAANAAALGVDLRAVDTAVLSHGHYDHGGGLKTFLALNDHAPVYLSQYAFEPHWRGAEKNIGLEDSLRTSDRLRFCGEETAIVDGLTLYAKNGAEKAVDLGSFGLMMKRGGALVPDDFRHEHYLLIEENGRRVLISGCSHKGILNIVRWFAPDVLVGGFHFSKLPLDGRLESYARQLAGYDTDYYTCHCTGVEQYRYMKQFMPNLHYLSTGDILDC